MTPYWVVLRDLQIRVRSSRGHYILPQWKSMDVSGTFFQENPTCLKDMPENEGWSDYL